MEPTVRIFLSHAAEDRYAVRDLYKRLSKTEFKPWMAEEDLLPGTNFIEEIHKAIQSSDFILVCLSTASLDKEGMCRQKSAML